MVKPDQRIGDIPSAKSVYKEAFRMAWPALTESFLVMLIGSADTAMVGQLGTRAISAVGICGQPRMILFCIFFALNVGVTAVIARRRGENRPDAANRTLRACLLIALALSVILGTLGFFLRDQILRLAGTQDDYFDMARVYFTVTALSLPLNALCMTITAAQRGAGNTRVSMRVNLTANIVNVIFNYFLIFGKFGFPKLGVLGAALATSLGTLVGLVLAIISVCKPKQFIRLEFHGSWLPDNEALKAIFSVSSSAAVEQLCLRIGFLIYARLVADLGTNDFATHQVCMTLLSISFSFGDGLTVAATALVGQNLGRKRADLSIIYGKACQRMGLVCAAIIIISFTCFGQFFVSLFTDEAYVLTACIPLLWLAAAASPFQIAQVITNGTLRGAGDTKFVAILSLVCITILRPVLSYVLTYPLGFGLIGAWFGMLLDQILRYAGSQWRYASGKWAKIKL